MKQGNMNKDWLKKVDNVNFKKQTKKHSTFIRTNYGLYCIKNVENCIF